MIKFLVIGAVTALVLTGTGCNSIPDGNPPEQIVEEQSNENSFTSAAGVNRLTTSLSAAVIKQVPANSIVATNFTATDRSLNFYPNKVFASVVEIGKFRPPAGPKADFDYCLHSNIKGSEQIDWEMKLVRAKDKATIWSESIRIDQSELIKR